MKEEILKILLENTDYKYFYNGGGKEPSIIVFTDSEDNNKEKYLSDLVDKIVKQLNNK